MSKQVRFISAIPLTDLEETQAWTEAFQPNTLCFSSLLAALKLLHCGCALLSQVSVSFSGFSSGFRFVHRSEEARANTTRFRNRRF